MRVRSDLEDHKFNQLDLAFMASPSIIDFTNHQYFLNDFDFGLCSVIMYVKRLFISSKIISNVITQIAQNQT